MFPLRDWAILPHGYEFGVPTFYSAHHLGIDHICAVGTPVFAPFNGTAVKNPFDEGGNVIDFHFIGTDDLPYVARFMHLTKYENLGQVTEGTVIGYTGNSGTLSSGPHLHTDLSRRSVSLPWPGNFIDPLIFNWNNTNNKIMSYPLYRTPDGTVFEQHYGGIVTDDALLIPFANGDQITEQYGPDWNSKVKDVPNLNGVGVDVRTLKSSGSPSSIDSVSANLLSNLADFINQHTK